MNPSMFLFVIIIYLVACVYVGRRITQIFSALSSKIIMWICVAFLSFLFFLQHIITSDSEYPLIINEILYIVSTMWLVVVLYSTTLFILFDIARLASRLRTGEKKQIKRGNIITIFFLVALILSIGIYNAKTPTITRYSIKVPHISSTDTIRIAITSDLHMGYGVGTSNIEKLRDMVNSENVDAFIIAGDLFDGDNRPVIAKNIGEPLSNINTKYGTFAIVGNHEYMGNIELAKNYIRQLGITLLYDSVATVGNMTFIGRNDIASARMFNLGTQRLELSKLYQKQDSTILFVIDHQPGAIEESVNIGADVHISGHTHAGQVWPMRVLTRMAFDQDYGYRQYDHTHAIVSSGFGTWGPRVRLGCKAELVILTITGF